ncbi:hypothetical protein [Celeribacter litoreus]|uniref:hypothetical protein n=1 Tax=Celeribacter litoreus TaxID=2876714 RepID=UPI001CCD1AE6|nr:hypothetical protein [Celeribacter litoreus]MCA0043360.1 hypothetical protein [Celeribacter litoreus]
MYPAYTDAALAKALRSAKEERAVVFGTLIHSVAALIARPFKRHHLGHSQA